MPSLERLLALQIYLIAIVTRINVIVMLLRNARQNLRIDNRLRPLVPLVVQLVLL